MDVRVRAGDADDDEEATSNSGKRLWLQHLDDVSPCLDVSCEISCKPL